MSTKLAVGVAVALSIAMVFNARADGDGTQNTKPSDAKPGSPSKSAETPSGVLLNDARAFPGYNLIDPAGKVAYLYDNAGRVVHSWTSEYDGFSVAYLLENGHLFRTAEATNRNQRFRGPAMGGHVQEFDWDGNVLWNFEYHSDKRQPHHDAIKMPNGTRC